MPDLSNQLIIGTVFGIVEGLTEFIPVSSTGHLILLGEIVGLKGESAATFEIFIQLGAICAVMYLYRKRFVGLFLFSKGKSSGFLGWNGITKLFLACAPIFLMGYLFHSTIKLYLFYPAEVSMALIFGGLIMTAVESMAKLPSKEIGISSISYKQALGIGIAQCFALWPGISRSASTIIGAMLLGIDRKTAAEFSFIIAVPVMFAAVLYDLIRSYHIISTVDYPLFAIGFIVSLCVAFTAVQAFLKILNRYTLIPFGLYRIALGVISLIYFLNK